MASELIWKKLSEEEKKKIEENSKKLILEFGDTLDKLPEMKESFVEREQFEREEGEGSVSDSTFRDLMFKNAPNVKDNCIIAEKGKWIE